MRRLHVLGVWDRPGPRLIAVPAEGGALESVPLEGGFAFTAGRTKTCVGDVGEDGVHQPCRTAEPVWRHRQCRRCSGLDDPECVFEPRCRDNPAACHCVTTFKGVPHVVYLAFHGTLPKVGLTTATRVEGRLREQGADAWMVVQPCPDRGTARQHEMAVSYLYGYPEHRSHRETLPQLARPVPWDAIEKRAADARLRLQERYPVERSLHRIDDYPIRQPVGGVPRRVPVEGFHEGTWIGAKGGNLVYREAPSPKRLDLDGGPLAALKRSDLVGRIVELR